MVLILIDQHYLFFRWPVDWQKCKLKRSMQRKWQRQLHLLMVRQLEPLSSSTNVFIARLGFFLCLFSSFFFLSLHCVFFILNSFRLISFIFLENSPFAIIPHDCSDVVTIFFRLARAERSCRLQSPF